MKPQEKQVEQRTYTLLRTGHAAAIGLVAVIALVIWLIVATGLNGFVYAHYAVYEKVRQIVGNTVFFGTAPFLLFCLLKRISIADILEDFLVDLFNDRPVLFGLLGGVSLLLMLFSIAEPCIDVTLVWSPHYGGGGLSKEDLDGIFWRACCSTLITLYIVVVTFVHKDLRGRLITITRPVRQEQ